MLWHPIPAFKVDSFNWSGLALPDQLVSVVGVMNVITIAECSPGCSLDHENLKQTIKIEGLISNTVYLTDHTDMRYKLHMQRPT